MRRGWLLLALLAAACGPQTEAGGDEVSVLAAVSRPVADVPLDELLFERGRALGNLWGAELDDGRRGRQLRWNDELHLFFTTGGGTTPYQLIHSSQKGHRTVVDTLDPMSEAIGVLFGAFDVAPCGERLLVVYGTPSDAYGSPSELRQSWGTWSDGRIEFSPPEAIFAGKRRVFDVRLLASDRTGTRVDLLWQMGERLAYSRLERGESRWADAEVVSATCLPRSASLASDGGRIYFAWSDQRYETISGFTTINGRKLMLRTSADAGRSFDAPLLLADTRDRKDSVDWTVLAFQGDDPALFARGQGADVWERYVLARDLSGYTSLEPVSAGALETAYEARRRSLLERRD